MLLTAWSYARFSQNSEKSGSAYSYTAESLGPKVVLSVGALLDYLLLPLINVLLAAIYLTALIPSLPYWFWVLVSAGLVTLVNCFRIRLLANLSLVFVFAPLSSWSFCIFSGPGYWLYPRLRTCTYLGSAMAWSAITITTCCWGLRSMLFILRF